MTGGFGLSNANADRFFPWTVITLAQYTQYTIYSRPNIVGPMDFQIGVLGLARPLGYSHVPDQGRIQEGRGSHAPVVSV